MGMGCYNFDPAEIADHDYPALFSTRRRDALFCFSFKEPDASLVMGRDHLGNVPLFYRCDNGEINSSIFIEELLRGGETVNREGLLTYLALGTIKIAPLFNEIKIVPPGSVIRAEPSGAVTTLYQYKINRQPLATGQSFRRCLETTDDLLIQAVGRTLRAKEVGLYLSGGVDSALTALYLKKAGAKISAYTAMPWGENSTEAKAVIKNANTLGITNHAMRTMETNRYGAYIQTAKSWYGNPNGTTSQMAILCLLQETKVSQEHQIYFAQNADTLACAVADQSLLYFSTLLPQPFRRRLHPALRSLSLMENYVALRTAGVLNHLPSNFRRDYLAEGTTLQKLTLVGMLFGHTPVDGEIAILPAIKQNQTVSNIFYDMDLIEFYLAIPWRHRLEWSRESKIGLALGKRLFKTLAQRHLPHLSAQPKKGLTVPVNRSGASRAFFSSLPTHAGDIALLLPTQRFAAEMLRRWNNQLPHPLISLHRLFKTN